MHTRQVFAQTVTYNILSLCICSIRYITEVFHLSILLKKPGTCIQEGTLGNTYNCLKGIPEFVSDYPNVSIVP